MRWLAARIRREERGWTLVEMLVAMSLGLLVLGAAGGVLIATSKSQPRTDTRSNAILKARFVIDGMTRELRQGWSVPTATASQLAILTYVNSATCGGTSASTAIACRVTYSCLSGACTRTESQPNGTAPGPAVQVTKGISSDNVFSYQPSSTAPTWVGVTLAFPGTNGSNALTLEDGAALRNPTSGT